MKQIKSSLKLIRRSPYQALAATIVMSLTFFVASIFIVLIIGGQMVLEYIEQRPQVITFFKDETTEPQIKEIIELVQSTGVVSKVKYVSREEALSIFRERNKDDPVILESVSADLLPASIDISVKRASDIPEITRVVKERKEVDKVITPEDLVEKLVRWTNTLRIGGVIFVSTLLSISFLIIIMVIGMRIAIRRDEITIMSLVGATKWYISRPFFIEGVLYGLVGASIAVLLIYIILMLYSQSIQEFLNPIEIFPISPIFFIYMWAAEVLAAAFVGIIGAIIALLRYLKIK